MQRRYLLAAAVALLAGVAGTAQAKPNFSGDWKMVVAKSDFGPTPAPDSLSVKIDHKDPDLNATTTQVGGQGDIAYDAHYNTEGKETTNTIGPIEAKSTVTWDGDDLAISTKLEIGGMDIAVKGKWSLSADGKTLTQTAHFTTPQGEFDMKVVLEKQEAAKSK